MGIRVHHSTTISSSSNSNSSIITEDPHNPLLEETQTSSNISSTMPICSSRPCTTIPNMLCRCSSTTQVWGSSILEVPPLLLPQCTRDHLGRNNLQSELGNHSKGEGDEM